MKEPIYGLLGKKLGHSWSVPIHQALGCKTYHLIELNADELAGFLAQDNLGGLNVTIPYKREVIPFCDVIDPSAEAIGSVNTIVRRSDGRLYAWNTDITGFRYMADRAGITLKDRKVLILGSGGASLTVQTAARLDGAREVVVVSRQGADNYDNLSRHGDADIIINTTPVGMYPNNGVAPVDLQAFPACQGVLDLIYNPQRTELLLQAEAMGIPCSDGLPMLVSQAVAAEERFFEKTIPGSETERILAMLRREATNIVLIGMPGSGKSTVGRALAALTGREALETDEAIVREAGCTIPEIFADGGEAAFRELERQAIANAGKQTGKIILTGGGAVKDPRNYAALRQNGRIYQLERPLELLPREGRPLSLQVGLDELYRQRAPLYARFRDVVTDNSGTPEAAAAIIWREFNEYFGN